MTNIVPFKEPREDFPLYEILLDTEELIQAKGVVQFGPSWVGIGVPDKNDYLIFDTVIPLDNLRYLKKIEL